MDKRKWCKRIHAVQALLIALLAQTFTMASGAGVMPVIAILASKYPRIAALLIEDAPVHALDCFYLPDATEQQLDPVAAITHQQPFPKSTKVLRLHGAV
jgi:hypothetical protein